MPDFTAIASILGSVKTATEIAKLLKESNSSLEQAEVKLQLADLISALADAKIETAEVQNLILQKDETIKELQESFQIKKNVKYEKPYYWLYQENKKEGPFCQHCYDKDDRLIRLQSSNDNGYWERKVCSNGYKDSTYVHPRPITIKSEWSDY